jgi:xylulokinase
MTSEEAAIAVIGCDVGSQSLKGVLLDDEGGFVAAAAEAYPVLYPRPGWAEQVPADWQRALARVVRSLLAQTGTQGSAVRALGLATQVDGLVAVDDRLEPLAPAVIWMDRRATRQTDRLRERFSAQDVLRVTGLNIDASHVAPKILWLRDACPELTARTRAYLLPGAYLVAALTGELVVDHGAASSTLLYDVRERAWSPDLLEATGIDAGTLPAVRAAREVAGTLRPAMADELGLTVSCRVVVGTGDEHAASLAAGAITEDVVCDITGTAEPVAAGTTRFVLDPTGLVETHAHADERAWLVENPGFVSGGSLRWFLDLVGIDERQMDAIAGVPPGSDGITFLPTMSGSTTPEWKEHARGVYAGLGLSHGREHLARAVIEGCTFALRDLVDRLGELGLGRSEVRVVGGGARSAIWLQMKADVTGRQVRVLATPEATAMGAAMLSGIGAGVFEGVDDAVARTTRLGPRSFDPDPSTADAYADAYARYRRLFEAMGPIFDDGSAA